MKFDHKMDLEHKWVIFESAGPSGIGKIMGINRSKEEVHFIQVTSCIGTDLLQYGFYKIYPSDVIEVFDTLSEIKYLYPEYFV